ncbi:MAG: hypothetical protein GX442_06160 [Candidatus Riflebacteria bacterium]|nr:hypothetical protein [Candidatus Riflebacteria bacterium]
MTNQEMAGLLVVATVNVTPSVILLGEAHACLRKGKPLGRLFYGAIALLLLQLACVGWAFLVEPDWIETTRHTLTWAHLPPDTRVRIVHLSDLHCEDTPGCRARLDDACRRIRDEKPDLVCLTGDFAVEPRGVAMAASFVAEVAALAPTFCVRGNWDGGPARDLHRAGGIWLERATHRLTVGSTTLGLAGIDFWDDGALEAVLPEVAGADLRIVLCHTPDRMPEAAARGAHLYLCGHTHGGQVRLPLYGAVITLAATGKRFEAGLYKLENMFGYTNRGLGLEGGTAPEIRFLCRPEVTVLDLRGPG